MSDSSKSLSALVSNVGPLAADDPRLPAALERVQPELDALTEDRLLPMNVDAMFVVQLVLGALQDLAQYVVLIAALPGFTRKTVEHLMDSALALLQTHTLYLGAATPTDDVATLAESATKTRESLALAGDALANRGLIPASTLADVRSGKSHRDIAGNVLTLVTVFEQHWAAVKHKTAIEESDLRAARALGVRLISAVGARGHGTTQIAEAALLRQRAFTLLADRYDQVRRAITFVRWNEGDADRIAPSLYSKSNPPPARKDTAGGETPAPTVPSAPAAPAIIPSSSPHLPPGAFRE